MNTATRTAIYVRVSTTGQEEGGSSLSTQEAACRAFAAERGYLVLPAHVYSETFSGIELWDRPQLTQLRSQQPLGHLPYGLGVEITQIDDIGEHGPLYIPRFADFIPRRP